MLAQLIEQVPGPVRIDRPQPQFRCDDFGQQFRIDLGKQQARMRHCAQFGFADPREDQPVEQASLDMGLSAGRQIVEPRRAAGRRDEPGTQPQDQRVPSGERNEFLGRLPENAMGLLENAQRHGIGQPVKRNGHSFVGKRSGHRLAPRAHDGEVGQDLFGDPQPLDQSECGAVTAQGERFERVERKQDGLMRGCRPQHLSDSR